METIPNDTGFAESSDERLDELQALVAAAEAGEASKTQVAQSRFVLKKLTEGDVGFLKSPRFEMFVGNDGLVAGFVEKIVALGFDTTPQENVHDWNTPFGIPGGGRESSRDIDLDR